MLKRVILIIFSILIAFGLFCGLLYSINIDLNSDTVVPGLVAMELFKHGNVQFTYPIDDPYLFTDIYTFYLVPQLLSGFNPMVLRLTAFFIFLLVLGVFSYLVYKCAGLVSALIFAALLVNISPAAYNIFIYPEYHVGTLLAAGVMIFLFNYDKIKQISFNRMLVYVLFMSAILLSDYLLLAMFIIPYIACYLLFYRNKPKKESTNKKGNKPALKGAGAWSIKEIKTIDSMIILMVLASAIVWLFKTYEPSFLWQYIYFNPRQSGTYGIYQAFVVSLPLYFQSLSYLVNQGLYNILSIQFSLIDIAIAMIFILTLLFSITRRNARAKYLYTMFLLSGVITFLGFVFLDRADGIWSARFLNYTAVSIFIVIALAYTDKKEDKKEKYNLNLLFLAAVIVLILSTVPYHIQKVSGLGYQPNQADHELISYLQANNITHAYSDFDGSNKLSYLSNEAVEVRPVSIVNNELKLYSYTWLGSTRWYSHGVDANPTFIVNNVSEFHNDLNGIMALRNITPMKTYGLKNYKIYVMPPP